MSHRFYSGGQSSVIGEEPLTTSSNYCSALKVQTMSQPRVTVTVGQGGQRSATISSGNMASDHSRGTVESRKRSVKDRLGGSAINVSPYTYPMTNKRQRAEFSWNQRAREEEEDEDVLLPNHLHNVQNARQDLRHKLDQKNYSRNRQFSNGSTITGNELRPKIAAPYPSQGQRIVLRRHPSLPAKGIPIVRPLPHATALASRIKAVQKVAVAIEQPTVATLLQSLGLGKYSITFQAEEIDMTALRNMNDDDLKELGLPMGPRKKILIALSSRK